MKYPGLIVAVLFGCSACAARPATDSTTLPYSIVVKAGVKEKYYEWLGKINDVDARAYYRQLDASVHPDLSGILEGMAVVLYHYTTWADTTKSYSQTDLPGIEFYGAELKGDTLLLQTGTPFADHFIHHYVMRGRARSFYETWYKYDRMVKAEAQDSLTNRLLTPARTVRMVLSDSVYRPGQILYGYIIMETAPYYSAEGPQETGDPHLQKVAIEYFFKALVRDEAYALMLEKRRLERLSKDRKK